MLFSPRAKFALKFEKAYQILITLTDPMRLVLFPLLFLDPIGFMIVYAAYAGLEIILWFWTKRVDSLGIVLLSPFYGMFNAIARFVGFPLWVKNRFDFVFRKQFHKLVPGRQLVAEYALIIVAVLALLATAIYRFPWDALTEPIRF